MARAKIPTALAMRELKYEDAPEAERDAVAERLRDEGRHSEALLLYEGRPDAPFVREEALWAVAEGNGFHLLALQRVGREVSEAEFRDCARAALDRGRWMDARHCFLAVGDREALQAIAEHLPEALKPEPPAGQD
jgi:hypothetical protein